MESKKKKVQKAKKSAAVAQKSFVRWLEIPSFSSLKTILSKSADLPKALAYRGKIKLHGTNAAVVVTKDGKVYAQRRNGVIDSSGLAGDGESNFAFGEFVYENPDYWKALGQHYKFASVAVFGEWCGRGIMAGAAICTISTRHFAVFCIIINGAYTMYDPDQIRAFLNMSASSDSVSASHSSVPSSSTPPSIPSPPAELLILPWMTDTFFFDYTWMMLHNDDAKKIEGRKNLQLAVNALNELVANIDAHDPFVLSTFNVDGIGEGLVFYPVLSEEVSPTHTVNGVADLGDYKLLSSLVFKAKGKSHRVMSSKDAALIDSQVATSVGEYADMFVTPQRCEQGFIETSRSITGIYTIQDAVAFTNWVSSDVKKEGKEEMGDLNPTQVDRAVRARAEAWFEQKMILMGISQEPQ